MLVWVPADQCIKEERSGSEINDRRACNANREDVTRAWTARWRRRADVGAVPNLGAGIGMERVHIVRFGDRNDHCPVWTALDVKRLGVHVTGDCSVEVHVAG